MSEATNTNISRRKLLEAVGTAAAAAAALGLAGPAVEAAETEVVSVKFTVSGKFDVFVIPFENPVASARMVLKGTSADLGGEITMTDMHTAHLSPDGSLNRSTNGMSVFAAPGGDALFVHWDGVGRPNPQTGELMGVAACTVRGGRGKFAGAFGTGIFNSELNVATGEVTQHWEIQVLRPRPAA